MKLISPKYEFGHIYVAKDLEFGDSSPEETEKLVIKKVSLDSAYQMILSGQICDMQSQIGILHYKLICNLPKSITH